MATDVKRGQIFSKLIRTITVAARSGGPDPDTNPQLRLATDRALAENMPKENVMRAIERATGTGEEAVVEALVLEAYGPGGAALMIDTVTDNRNRTVAEVRRILSNHAGTLGESGSVAWQFERRGLLTVENAPNPEKIELAAIDAGASDIERDGSTLDITAAPENLKAVTAALEAAGVKPSSSEVALVPKQWFGLDEESMGKLQRLMEDLEEHDDVVSVTTNAAPPT